MYESILREALSLSLKYLEGVAERRVPPEAAAEQLRAELEVPLTAGGEEADDVLRHLAESMDPGLMHSAGPRFFGFVVGGSHPVSVAADWLAAAWDQNAGLFVLGPGAAIVEDVTGRWLLDLLGLPESASFGFVTGAQMANFTGLAAGRNHVLRACGWDVEKKGLLSAPRIRVFAGEEAHATIGRSLRYLGLGSDSAEVVEADGQGRMDADALAAAMSDVEGPALVCAQAGNVSTGAFDPLGRICDIAHDAGAWVHVDGAFGMWAAASPRLAHLMEGATRADSWATDGHKWLNVPYDSGIAFCAHPEAHAGAMSVHASYLVQGGGRDALDWNPESSRRARGLAIYATLRVLGRDGVARLVERCCDHARSFAEILGAAPGVEILNDVVLNQVLVRFESPDGDHDARTTRVIEGVQRDGTCWLGGGTWKGQKVMRISVSNWMTSTEDVQRSADAILRVAQQT